MSSFTFVPQLLHSRIFFTYSYLGYYLNSIRIFLYIDYICASQGFSGSCNINLLFVMFVCHVCAVLYQNRYWIDHLYMSRIVVSMKEHIFIQCSYECWSFRFLLLPRQCCFFNARRAFDMLKCLILLILVMQAVWLRWSSGEFYFPST